MKYLTVIFGFAVIAHVKCQVVDIADILYGEDDEEDDQNDVTTTTTPRPTTAAPIVTAANVRLRQEQINNTFAATNLNNSTVAQPMANHTFFLQPANNTIFGANLVSTAAVSGSGSGAPAAATERVHYVLGQVGNIFNSVGGLNVTGIVDQALGIRNSQIARPLVNGILNVVLCNPFTFSENNCQRRTAEK